MKKTNVLFMFTIIAGIFFAGCQNNKNPVNPVDTNSGTISLDKKGMVVKLSSDLTVTETYLIPDGYTLDGHGHTITAVDPVGGHFVGAVVMNGGTTAYVKNLTVTTAGLSNVCDGGADRLRGIMFEGASGSITNCTIIGINQGPSGCQEGNAIEVRNAPFDGTHPNTVKVKIEHNKIFDYQKSGIVCNGDVNVELKHNTVGASFTQENLAANSIQLGFGATGKIEDNKIDGNQWKGTSNYVATAILIYLADNVKVSKNKIGGNSDIGIYFYGDNGKVDKNKVYDEGPDDPNSGYDIGIGNWGSNNIVTKNHVKGFDIPFDGPIGKKNKSLHKSKSSIAVNPFQ